MKKIVKLYLFATIISSYTMWVCQLPEQDEWFETIKKKNYDFWDAVTDEIADISVAIWQIFTTKK